MRDRKRLFLAIEISQEAKDYFRDFKDRLFDFPGRWTDINNLHLTLSFLGNVNEGDIPILVESLGRVFEKNPPFKLKIEKVSFNTTALPGEKLPKMIWGEISESTEIQKLYIDVANSLRELPFSVHSQRPRISPHITLCRFNSISLRRWHSSELPKIDEDISISFPVYRVQLMESKLRRSGPEYFVLQSFTLGA